MQTRWWQYGIKYFICLALLELLKIDSLRQKSFVENLPDKLYNYKLAWQTIQLQSQFDLKTFSELL